MHRFYSINKTKKRGVRMLKVGDRAPNFTLPDGNNNSVSLMDFLGNKVILWFFPKASTPG